MTLSYTADQLTREAQLLLCEFAVLADLVIGEGAGLKALNQSPEGHFAQTRHPDDLTEVEHLDIWKNIAAVERYARAQAWADQLPYDITMLGLALERIFSPTIVSGYEGERLSDPQPAGIPGAWEEGAGAIGLGHFHLGILASLVSLARARLKIDKGERLTMADIALLLGIKEATVVTNAHRKNFVSIEEDNRRYAEPVEVLPWMLKQGYRPTLKGGVTSEGISHFSTDADVIFVPVSKDGAWFSPEDRHNGRYVIGNGKHQRNFQDYFEALTFLVGMPTPRWRSKRNGVAGLAFGVRFDRVSRKTLTETLSTIVN